MKRIYLLIAIAFIGFVGLGVINITEHKQEIKLKDVQLRSVNVKLESLHLDYQKLEQDYKQADINNVQQMDELKKRNEELDNRNKELERQEQAKLAEKQRLANISTTPKAYAAPAPSVKPTGNCAEWIAAAGITDTVNANELIRRESGCNPYAVNKSSGACGIAQELPCGKSGCSFGDGACQVRWMNQYVLGRYGSWSAAVAYHSERGWY